MIVLQNVLNLKQKKGTVTIPSFDDVEINADGLMLLPGLIDPHVHFRTPGQEYKEDWRTAAAACIRGGYTTVFDMPNNIPACITEQRLTAKKEIIEQQLSEIGIPLNYQLYFGADKEHFEQLAEIKQKVIALKVFMGSSTGDLLMDDDSSLHAVFALAAQHDMLLAVHAEDECRIHERTQSYAGSVGHAMHSKIRDPEAARIAVNKAINLAEMYGTQLYILHVSTQVEIALISAAKKRGLPVFAETTPHHLFLDDTAYEVLFGCAQMNPPLRSVADQNALWQGIQEGYIDTIGSDHAPHTLQEKSQPYGTSPSGVPGIETSLPSLLNAYNQGKISLEKIVALTHDNIQGVFGYQQPNNNYVLVDLNQTKEVTNSELKTKCAWSPFAGRVLQGWPVYTILNGHLFNVA